MRPVCPPLLLSLSVSAVSFHSSWCSSVAACRVVSRRRASSITGSHLVPDARGRSFFFLSALLAPRGTSWESASSLFPLSLLLLCFCLSSASSRPMPVCRESHCVVFFAALQRKTKEKEREISLPFSRVTQKETGPSRDERERDARTSRIRIPFGLKFARPAPIP